MFVADTNVLVYAADEDASEHERCRELLEQWRRRSTPFYLTWGIVYEFLRVTTHRGVFPRPWTAEQAWTFVDAVLAAPAAGLLVATPSHAGVLAEVVGEIPGLGGNLVHDAHTATLMREHGIARIVTRDTDFHRFPFLEVVDPLAG